MRHSGAGQLSDLAIDWLLGAECLSAKQNIVHGRRHSNNNLCSLLATLKFAWLQNHFSINHAKQKGAKSDYKQKKIRNYALN